MIFETSYNIGLIPRDWKFANTVLMYKKGNKAEVKNYRPVSLTNVCKVMECIIVTEETDAGLDRPLYLRNKC